MQTPKKRKEQTKEYPLRGQRPRQNRELYITDPFTIYQEEDKKKIVGKRNIDYLTSSLKILKDIVRVEIINYKNYPVSFITIGSNDKRVVYRQNTLTYTFPLSVFDHTPLSKEHLVLALSVKMKKDVDQLETFSYENSRKNKNLGFVPIPESIDFTRKTVEFVDRVLAYYFRKTDIIDLLNEQTVKIIPDYSIYEQFGIRTHKPERFKQFPISIRYKPDIMTELEHTKTVNCLKFYYGTELEIKIQIYSYVSKEFLLTQKISLDNTVIEKMYSGTDRVWKSEFLLAPNLGMITDTGTSYVRCAVVMEFIPELKKAYIDERLKNEILSIYIPLMSLGECITHPTIYSQIPGYIFLDNDIQDEKFKRIGLENLLPKKEVIILENILTEKKELWFSEIPDFVGSSQLQDEFSRGVDEPYEDTTNPIEIVFEDFKNSLSPNIIQATEQQTKGPQYISTDEKEIDLEKLFYETFQNTTGKGIFGNKQRNKKLY